MGRLSVVICACLLATACSRAPVGSNSDISTGPDEFAVQTNRALVQPADYVSLPTPTPGSANRADIDPNADAIAALGGRAGRADIPASDSALIAQTGRFGVEPDIRATLATTASRRLFGGAVRLDAYAELERFRALGVTTPTAPPR